MNTKKTGQVILSKRNSYYKVQQNAATGGPVYTIAKYTSKKSIRGFIDPIDMKNNYVIVTPTVDPQLKTTSSIKASTYGSYPRNVFFSPYDKESNPTKKQVVASSKFHFIEQQPIFQGISIPIKYRPGINDSVKSSASAEFNAGFAFGWKCNFRTFQNINTIYNPDGKALTSKSASRLRNFSITPGVFLGPSIINLSSDNTNQAIKKDRSVVGLTDGGFLVLGYNQINIGFSAGFDHSFGKNSKEWIYNDKLWIGFIVAIDLIK